MALLCVVEMCLLRGLRHDKQRKLNDKIDSWHSAPTAIVLDALNCTVFQKHPIPCQG